MTIAVLVVAVLMAEVVAAPMVDTKSLAAVVVVRDAIRCMVLLLALAMASIEVNIMSVIGPWILLSWQYWVQQTLFNRG